MRKATWPLLAAGTFVLLALAGGAWLLWAGLEVAGLSRGWTASSGEVAAVHPPGGDEARAPVLALPFEGGEAEGGAAGTDSPAAGEAKVQTGLLVSRMEEGRARLVGRWSTGDGEPAVRRRVRLHRIDGNGLAAAQMVVGTGEDGSYAAWVEPGSWRVRFDREAYELVLGPSEERRLDHRDLDGRGTTLRVRVSGADVQPWNALVTVEVRAQAGPRQVMQARTGKDGRAEFANLRAGRGTIAAQLQRRSGGWSMPARTEVEVPESGELEVELRQPRGRLALLVVGGEDGPPIAGAEVEFWPEGEAHPAVSVATSEDGRARIDGVPPGPGILRVRHPSQVPLRSAMTVRESGSETLVVLDRGASVAVRATDEEGRPMAIMLRARSRNETPKRVWEWRLDEDGRGTMDRLPAENVELELIAAGCEPILVHSGDLRTASRYDLVFRRKVQVGR